MTLTLRYGDSLPPLPLEIVDEASDDDSDGDVDTVNNLTLVPCHAQRNYSPHCKRANSENSFFEEHEPYPTKEHTGRMSMEGIAHAGKPLVSAQTEVTPLQNQVHKQDKVSRRERAGEENFLSLFEDEGFAPLSHDFDLSALSGIFRSFNILARSKQQTVGSTHISEAELQQHFLRSM